MLHAIKTSRNYKWWAFGAIAMGLFLGVLDQSGLNIAIPVMASHFGTDIPTAQWIFLGFVLTTSVVLMPAGRFSDILGRKRVYVTGLSIFTLGGILAASSSSLVPVIVFKAAQGVGNGMIVANNMAIIAALFPGKEQGKGMGLLSTTVGLGAISGPLVGGSLVTTFGWRSVFILSVALSVLTLIAVVLVVEERRITPPRDSDSRPSFDWIGAIISSFGLVLLLLALTNGGRLGWTSPLVLVGLFGFPVMLAGFIIRELKARSPMLDLRLFTRRVFSLGVTARAMGMLGSAPSFFLMPFYLQGVLGFTAQGAGMVMVSSSAGMAAAAFICGRLSDRFGWKPFISGGLALVIIGIFLLSRLTEDTPLGLVIAGLTLQGVGMGAFISPNLSAILGTVEREKHGVTTAMLNLVRTATNLTAVAIATAIVAGVMTAGGFEPRLDVAVSESVGAASAFTDGLRLAYLVMSGCVLLGFVASLFLVQKRDG
jgi:EmrB/QacA subfamily drug resistance transporter